MDVLYRDEWLLAVDKPAGIIVHGDGTGAENLTDRVRVETGCAAAQPVQPVLPVQPILPVQPVQPLDPQEATVYNPQQPQLPDPEPQSSVSLYLYSGPMAGTSFRNPVGRTVTLGRNPARSDIVLSQYEVVSGAHCQIGFFSDYITIVDLNSTNGTYVNGVRLTPHQPVSARSGATIYLANSSCAFQVRFQ